VQGRRSGGIKEIPVKREKENQNGIIRDVIYETNYMIAKYDKVSSHKTIPLMRRISKVALACILPYSLLCYSHLQE
jgi:hypothetical protein